MGNELDITGERYGKLVAIKKSEKRGNCGQIYWTFQCDCGNTKDCDLNGVRRGLIKSCGCLLKPHGETKTRLHRIWCGMRERCRNDGHKQYERWGGRGISICKEWDDYRVFRDWALSHGYADNLTIDRIDNDGNYEPSNCRWITYKEQARNTSRNHYITINGESHLLKDWCEILGNISPSQAYKRMRIFGWSAEKALTTPGQRYIPLDPEKSDKRFDKIRVPVIAKKDGEVLYFRSGKEVADKGFCREMAMKAAKGKAKCKTNRHFYKGYEWEIDTEKLKEMRGVKSV